MCLLVVLVALFARALGAIAGGGAPAQPFQVLFVVLGLAVVILWIGQGVLAAQVSLGLGGQVNTINASSNRLLIVSMSVENRGVRQARISAATVVVCPDACARSTFPYTNDPERYLKDRAALGFATTAIAEQEFGGNTEPEYYLTWGTQETRQVAFEVPPAKSYEIHFSLGTGEIGTSTVNKWRATRIVPTEYEYVSKDHKPVFKTGKSPEIEGTSHETSATLELLKKFLGAGSKE
jgi:hypothetical protein